jgi:hypothetical protein
MARALDFYLETVVLLLASNYLSLFACHNDLPLLAGTPRVAPSGSFVKPSVVESVEARYSENYRLFL